MRLGRRLILALAFGWMFPGSVIGATGDAEGPRKQQAPDDPSRFNDEVERLLKEGQPDVALKLCERGLARQRAALGPRHPDVARSLNNLGDAYKQLGQYARAEAPYQEALAIRKEALGPHHLDVAKSLSSLGLYYANLGQYTRSEAIQQEALILRRKALGPRHLDVAKSLNNIGILYMDIGQYARAEALHQEALSIRKEALGPRHQDVASSLSSLGILYWQMGQYARAEALHQEALAIRKEALGPRHQDVATTLTNLGIVYRAMGQYVRAETVDLEALAIYRNSSATRSRALANLLGNMGNLYKSMGQYDKAQRFQEEALAMRKAMLGSRHPLLAHSLNDQGELYALLARYSQAEPLYQEALAIWRESLGPKHTQVAVTLHNLADLYWDTGQYARAEAIHQEALAIRKEVLPPNHPDLASSQHHLARLYSSIGQYAKAEALYLAALSIWRTSLGPRHLNVAEALNHLSNLYRKMGQCQRGEPLQQEALAIRREVLPPNHPDLAKSLNNLGQLFSCLGRYETAEPLYREALEIRRKALGKKHPEIAHTLNHLANLYRETGQYAKAEPLYQEALAMRNGLFGPRHPDTARLLHEQGLLHLARQAPAEAALPLLQRSFEIDEQLVDTIVSESRLTAVLRTLRAREDDFYSLLAQHPQDPAAQRLALAVALLRKGRSATEGLQTQRAIQQALTDPQDRALFQRLTAARGRLAALYYKEFTDAVDARTAVAALEGEVDALEQELARHTAAFRSLQTPDPADVLGRVAGALPKDAALIEWLEFTPRRFAATGQEPRQGPPRYLALVLFPDQRVRALDLGETKPIDDAVAALLTQLRGRQSDVLPAAQRLYQLVMAPLRPALEGRTHLVVSPDGALNLVPLWALHDGQRYLLDDHDISYLTSGRDLLRPPATAPQAVSVAVLASPDFRLASAGGPAATTRSGARPDATRAAYLPQLSHLSALPGTQAEAQAIQQLFPQARLLLGRAASEAATRSLAAPTVLHIATHGVFLDEPAVPGGRGRTLQVVPGQRRRLEGGAVNPLARSALLLAGVEGLGAPGQSPPEEDDGLLTALEVSGLDLWGTQLVVLSACDTGRGDVQPGQGVYGLRRAFFNAGAETLVTSLWQVADRATQGLMESYYRNLLAGQGRATAMRQAALATRAQHPHPYFWAPFIVLGADEPLRGLQTPQSPATPRPQP